MKFILGKKLEMTQVWQGDKLIAVTRVLAGPCPIIQVKTKNNDGYEAVQLGFGEKKEKNIKKPQLGQLAKLKALNLNVKTNLKYLKEFKTEIKDLKVGDVIDASTFAVGDIIKVTGTAKGKGFQGVVRRHGFHGQDKTHGNKDQLRHSGSISAGGIQRVLKGTRMGGRMGDDRVTVKNLEVIGLDKVSNILLVKGAVPGARNSLVLISGEGELKIQTPNIAKETLKDTKVQAEESKQKAEEKTETVGAKNKQDANSNINIKEEKKGKVN